MKKITLLILLIISIHSFGQQNGIKESFPKKTIKLDENTQRLSLKEFVENIYINSLNTFEGEKPLMNVEELNVQMKRNSGKFQFMKLKDLNDISVDQIKSFEYKKDKKTEALYGVIGELFGMVTVELK